MRRGTPTAWSEEQVGRRFTISRFPAQKEEKKIFGVAAGVGMTIADVDRHLPTELTQWRYG